MTPQSLVSDDLISSECVDCLGWSSNFTTNTSSAAGRNVSQFDLHADYIFKGREVKACLVIAYTFVFCCCFFGNLLVMTVVIAHRRMHTVTNYLLTNLAVADLCVGLFCVYQNLSFYLTTNWAFGEFLCKMYHFVNTLSYTASIAILMVISVERYVAIVHPIWSKQVMTKRRLRVTSAIVWLMSAAYCSPRLVMYGTTQITLSTGVQENICILKRYLYDSRTYDLVTFVVCFVLPLIVITVLYFIICYRLWEIRYVDPPKESDFPTVQCISDGVANPDSVNHCSTAGLDARHRTFAPDIEAVGSQKDRQRLPEVHRKQREGSRAQRVSCERQPPLRSSTGSIIQSRRKVIRLLVSVVFTFALCNLPFHARKLWQYWSPKYDGTSQTSVIITITTTLVLYMNSGINPFLYAFFSANFRNSMLDVIFCRGRRFRLSRTIPSLGQSSTRVTLRRISSAPLNAEE